MGYFDLQVNGYAGVDFNQDDLSATDLHHACAQLRRDGVDNILATLITEKEDVLTRRIERLSALRNADPDVRSVIAGLHLEGPFLSAEPGYRGAHPADAIRPADEALAEKLLAAGAGLVRLVTLAPEQDPSCRVIRLLVRHGVTVSAGHTDASLPQLEKAIDAGLSMFTHFGNACPSLLPRHDNILQRALYLRKHLWLGFIADGVHIPLPTLRNYLDLVLTDGNGFVTTDAMAAAGLGPGFYSLGRWEVQVGEDLAARSPDGTHLLGSAMPLAQAARNLSRELGLDAATVRLLTDTNPRQALGVAACTLPEVA